MGGGVVGGFPGGAGRGVGGPWGDEGQPQAAGAGPRPLSTSKRPSSRPNRQGPPTAPIAKVASDHHLPDFKLPQAVEIKTVTYRHTVPTRPSAPECSGLAFSVVDTLRVRSGFRVVVSKTSVRGRSEWPGFACKPRPPRDVHRAEVFDKAVSRPDPSLRVGRRVGLSDRNAAARRRRGGRRLGEAGGRDGAAEVPRGRGHHRRPCRAPSALSRRSGPRPRRSRRRGPRR